MTATALLAGYAVLMALAGARLLNVAGWSHRSPRLGVVAWSAVVVSVTAAAVGAGVTATVPLLKQIGGLAEVVHRCRYVFRAAAAHPYALTLALVGISIGLGVVSALAKAIAGELRSCRRVARAHLRALRLLGRERDGLVVLEAPQPAAWCVESAGGVVVVTSAALEALSRVELEAVAAHERAHLAGRHSRWVAVLAGVERALPVPVVRRAAGEIRVLLEMRADDVAARQCGRPAVAAALLALTGVGPPGVLHASGFGVPRRFERLTGDIPRIRVWTGLPIVMVAAASVVLPATVAAWATMAVIGLHFCPVPA